MQNRRCLFLIITLVVSVLGVASNEKVAYAVQTIDLPPVESIKSIIENKSLPKGDVKSLTEWSNSDASAQGENCFDYYKFQSVQVSFGAEKNNYQPGEKIIFNGDIINRNTYPVVDGYVFARISRKNQESIGDGNFVIDEITPLSNITLDASERQKKKFEWVVPQNTTAGDYRIDYFFSVGKKLSLGGLSFSNEVIIGTSNFTIDGENLSAVFLDRSSTEVNSQKYHHIGNWPTVNPGKPVNISQTLINTFPEVRQTEVTYDLFYWDSLDEKDIITTKKETIDIPAKGSRQLKYILDSVDRSVYYLRITAISANQKSIINIRFLSEQESPRLNFPALNKFPLKEGDEVTLFSCFHNTSSSLALEGKVMVTLTDKDGQEVAKTEYSGKISSAMAVTKKDFVAQKNYDYLKVSAQVLDKNGKQVDVYSSVYDCSQLKSDKCIEQASKIQQPINRKQLSEPFGYKKIAFSLALLLVIFTVVVVVFTVRKRRIKNASNIIILFFAMLIGWGICSQNASAYNDKSVSPSADFGIDKVTYYWMPENPNVCGGAVPIINTGNMTVTHKMGMLSGDYLVNVNQPISFEYKDPEMFFVASGGAWGSPYGEWRNTIDNGDYDSAKFYDPTYGLPIFTPSFIYCFSWGCDWVSLQSYTIFTGVKPTEIYMISSDPSVVSCTGMNCVSNASGIVTLTAHIPETQTRPWTMFNSIEGGWQYTSCVRGGCSCSKETNVLPIPEATISWDITVASSEGKCNINAIGDYEWDETSFRGNLCSSGVLEPAVVNFPLHGQTASWDCLGADPSKSEFNCSAYRKNSPNSVTLSATPNPLENLNNDSKIVGAKSTDLEWIINNPEVCGTGCTCDLTGPDGTISNLPYSDPKSTHTVVLGKGSHNFSVICKNSDGMQGNTATAVVTGICNEFPYVSDCTKTCGEDYKYDRKIEPDCDDVFVGQTSCGLSACPVSSEWKEVRP